MRTLQQLTRPNIWTLAPYSSARNEYAGHEASVFLDANESPYNSPYNRYPDPLQTELKKRISQIKGIPSDNIFLGNGSDEAIDLIYRCFCQPAQDNVVAISPTYGMYQVCADINNVEYRTVPLNSNYDISAADILDACDNNTKVIWICSPNNPTGNSISRNEIFKILQAFDGIVVIDEAYIDFSHETSMLQFLKNSAQDNNATDNNDDTNNNFQSPTLSSQLVILQTLSKAWASAAIRLGMAFASKDIITLFNKVKYPYNVNLLTQQQALKRLNNTFDIEEWIRLILRERTRVMQAFTELKITQHVYPTEANFFLAKVNDAQQIYDYLVSKGIIVRNRSHVTLCNNCLRITIGNKDENNALLAALRSL